MSDVDQTTTRSAMPEAWTARRIAAGGALAATVLVLVAGAVLLGTDSGPYERAGERIAALYEEGDVEAMMASFVDGTVPPEQEDATANALAQILRPGVGVAQVAEPVEVSGVPIVRVTTNDRIEWCVRPDGAILPRCRVGEVAIETETDAPIRTVLARADLPLAAPTQLTLALETTGADPAALDGLALDPAQGGDLDAELVQAVNVLGGQPTPVDPAAPTLEPAATLYLTWLTDDALSDRDLVLSWEGGTMALDLRQVRWFVR